jgi:hypothetical protein
LLLVINAVLGEQFPQFLAADAALAGFDPADLRAVTFEDPRRIVKCVAQVLAVPAKRSADDPSPWGGAVNTDESPFGLVGFRMRRKSCCPSDNL